MLLVVILCIIIFLIVYLYLKKNDKFTNIGEKKIAFLFLITDIINKEDLWYDFFKKIDTNKYSIYIHYKTNDQLKYFNDYKIKNIIETKWADISLVKAEQLLLKEALKDEMNYKFIFVSGSCIPIKHFNYIYDFLVKDNNSYFNTVIKKSDIYKTFQWCILNREHAQIIANDTEEIKKFEHMFAPDELYILSTLKKLNDKNIVINMTPDTFTTYANWGTGWIIYNDDFSNKYKKFNSDVLKQYIILNKYPYNYIKLDDNELKYLVNDTKCLFMRKITKECILNEKILPYVN
jgi:hypothetical protein